MCDVFLLLGCVVFGLRNACFNTVWFAYCVRRTFNVKFGPVGASSNRGALSIVNIAV